MLQRCFSYTADPSQLVQKRESFIIMEIFTSFSLIKVGFLETLVRCKTLELMLVIQLFTDLEEIRLLSKKTGGVTRKWHRTAVSPYTL